jgi:hypothetical protein
MCLKAVYNSNKISCQLFSHSVLVLTHLFINTYTLRAVPEHAMGWEQWWERKNMTNYQQIDITTRYVLYVSAAKTTNNWYFFISNIFFHKSKFFRSPEFFSLSTCIYCTSKLRELTLQPKQKHYILMLLFLLPLCVSRHGRLAN